MIVELEKVTGFGIGAIFARAVDLHFGHREVIETIRLGLIGGGMSDNDAADLVATYIAPRPIHEVHPISRSVLRALWFGPAPAEAAEQPEDVA